jgi:hypothetical protein
MFKHVFPLPSPSLQDEASLSTPFEPLPFVSCVVVSSNDDKGKIIVVDSTGKTPDGKKRKLYEHVESFNTLGPFDTCGFFFTKNSIHAKNEQCYTVTDYPSVLDHLQANVLSEQRQNTSNLLLSIIFLQMVVQ